MTDAGYEHNLSKQNLFSILAKKTQLILFLDNYGSTYDTNDDLNAKMYFGLKNQLEITTVVERNESRIFKRDITHFKPVYPFIFVLPGAHQ